jgi:hypothetical protein
LLLILEWLLLLVFHVIIFILVTLVCLVHLLVFVFVVPTCIVTKMLSCSIIIVLPLVLIVLLLESLILLKVTLVPVSIVMRVLIILLILTTKFVVFPMFCLVRVWHCCYLCYLLSIPLSFRVLFVLIAAVLLALASFTIVEKVLVGRPLAGLVLLFLHHLVVFVVLPFGVGVGLGDGGVLLVGLVTTASTMTAVLAPLTLVPRHVGVLRLIFRFIGRGVSTLLVLFALRFWWICILRPVVEPVGHVSLLGVSSLVGVALGGVACALVLVVLAVPALTSVIRLVVHSLVVSIGTLAIMVV